MKSPKETAYSGQGGATAEGGVFPLVSADSGGHFTREKCEAQPPRRQLPRLPPNSPLRGIWRSMALAAFALLTACAPSSHEPLELPDQCAAEVEPEPSAEPDPTPSAPYALYVSDTLNESAVEAAHTRQAGRILNDRLGHELFVWSGYASFDEDAERCNTVLVTRGAETVLYAEGCRWIIELAEGGLVGDDEVRQISELLALTLAGAP